MRQLGVILSEITKYSPSTQQLLYKIFVTSHIVRQNVQKMVIKTREKLIEVARQLFMHKGVENTTMNDIANASEKGRRTIYTYFKNKKDIYNAVLESETDRIVYELRVPATVEMSATDRLRAFLLRRLEQGVTVGSGYSSLRSLFKFDLRRTERIRRMVHEKEAALYINIIDDGIRAGEFDAARCKLLNSFIEPCIQGMDAAGTDAQAAGELRRAQQAFVDFVIDNITLKQDLH